MAGLSGDCRNDSVLVDVKVKVFYLCLEYKRLFERKISHERDGVACFQDQGWHGY